MRLEMLLTVFLALLALSTLLHFLVSKAIGQSVIGLLLKQWHREARLSEMLKKQEDTNSAEYHDARESLERELRHEVEEKVDTSLETPLITNAQVSEETPQENRVCRR